MHQVYETVTGNFLKDSQAGIPQHERGNAIVATIEAVKKR